MILADILPSGSAIRIIDTDPGGQNYADPDPHYCNFTYDSHTLEDTVDVLEPLEQLLHHLRLVEVGPQGDQDLLVMKNELPQLSNLKRLKI